MENYVFHKLMYFNDTYSKNIIKLYALKYTLMYTQVCPWSVQMNTGQCCQKRHLNLWRNCSAPLFPSQSHARVGGDPSHCLVSL